MLRLIFARKNHRIFLSKIYGISSVLHGCMLSKYSLKWFWMQSRIRID